MVSLNKIKVVRSPSDPRLLREVGDLIYAYLFNISMKTNKGGE